MTLSREETPARQRVSRDRRLKCQRGHYREQLLSPHSNGQCVRAFPSLPYCVCVCARWINAAVLCGYGVAFDRRVS